jgi:hypothetical protein
MISTDREWLHRVVSRLSPTAGRAARERRFQTFERTILKSRFDPEQPLADARAIEASCPFQLINERRECERGIGWFRTFDPGPGGHSAVVGFQAQR